MKKLIPALILCATAYAQIPNGAQNTYNTSHGSHWQSKANVDVRDLGATGNGQSASDCWMTSGSAVLTCTGNHFVAADVGKRATVYGAGPTTSTFIQPLTTTIAGFTSATQVTLTDNAANSNTQTACAIAASPTGAVMATTGIVTITCNANHNFAVNQEVIISGVLDPRFNSPKGGNGTYTTLKIASTPSGTTFTYQSSYRLVSGTATSGSGTANGNSERVLWGTDDTAAIQAAVDSLAATANTDRGGGTVYFPARPGTNSPTIYLTKGIQMLCSRIGAFSTGGTCTKSYNNISLEGAGRDSVTMENWDIAASCTGPIANACTPIVLGQKAGIPQNEGGPDANARLSHIKISGLTIRQIKHPNTNNSKVILDGSTDDVNIFNNTIIGYSFECLVQAGGFTSRNWHVHDNNFGPCGRGGPSTSASTSAINMNASWSEAYNNYISGSGQCIETGGHHMIFKQNWCLGTNVPETPSDGINIGSTGAGIWDIVIDGNTVADYISGLVMGNASGTMNRISVTNNTFRDAPAFLSGGGESNTVTFPQIEVDTVVHGNSIFAGNKTLSTYYTSSGNYGILVGTNGFPQLSQEHWTISNNTLSSLRDFSGQSGIFVVFASNSPKGWTAATVCTSTGQIPTIVMPTVPNGSYYRCTTGGTSGATEPTWCVTPACTVADNTAVWTRVGAMPITSVSNLRFDLPAGGGSAFTDIAWDSTNMESVVFDNVSANYVWSNDFRTPWLGGVAISLGAPSGAVMDTPPVNSLFGTKYHYASAIPRTQKWSLGDLVWSTSPTSGYVGWIVTTAGYATDTWAAAQAYNFNYYLAPTTANGHFYRQIVAAGCTSAGGEPVFPAGAGATVADNTCTWQESGAAAVFSAFGPVATNSAASSYPININGTVGATTPTTGTFTTISASGQVTSTLATGTAPLVIASTTTVPTLTVSNHPKVQACGTTSTCSATAMSSGQIVQGSAALVSGTPSAVTITAISPAFTSTATYNCTATEITNPANNLLSVTKVSGSSITITGPNTLTDVVSFICAGN